MSDSELKRCSLCGEHKPRNAFALTASSKDGLDHRCRDCHRERMRAYRATAVGRAASDAADRRNYERRKELSAIAAS